jgi:hypothetical protein
MKNFSRKAAVTGGASGIGLAAARTAPASADPSSIAFMEALPPCNGPAAGRQSRAGRHPGQHRLHSAASGSWRMRCAPCTPSSSATFMRSDTRTVDLGRAAFERARRKLTDDIRAAIKQDRCRLRGCAGT